MIRIVMPAVSRALFRVELRAIKNEKGKGGYFREEIGRGDSAEMIKKISVFPLASLIMDISFCPGALNKSRLMLLFSVHP
jgi:hypothetical protein